MKDNNPKRPHFGSFFPNFAPYWSLLAPLSLLPLWGPVSIILYNRPGSNIKWHTPNYVATLRHVNLGVIHSEHTYKVMNPISSGSLPKVFKESSLQLWYSLLILTLLGTGTTEGVE